jgi:hypothetical protein
MTIFDVMFITFLACLMQRLGGNRERGDGMDFNNEIAPVYMHHDLLIEIGKVEMAMDYLNQNEMAKQEQLLSRLQSKMSHLRDELMHLAV